MFERKKRVHLFKVGMVLFSALTLKFANTQFSCTTNCQECFGPGTNQCTSCKAGYYLVDYQCKTACLADKPNQDTYDRICKATIYDTDLPCPHGTYNPSEGAQDTSSCKACDTGYYCPYQGQSDKNQMCAAGYYCFQHSPFKMPNTALTSQVDSNYYQASYGGYCSPGQYCQAGTSQPTDCDPGFYCPNYLMSELDTTKKCKAGFYCVGKAKVATPQDGVTGNICPSGNYCPEGSINALKCPAGTFLSYTGAQSAAECQLCTPGKYCATDGLNSPTGDCAQGYYCPEGQSQSSPIEYQCPQGYTCPAGSQLPQRCPSGQYTRAPGSFTCEVCPVGQYCTDLQFGIPCEKGNYCPGGNLLIQCPAGTYSATSSNEVATKCLTCDAGYACELTGLNSQNVKCDNGFICTGGTITTRPWLASQGGRMCVPGEYCPTGASTATSCPAGKYCKDYASGVTTGDCEAGYYCPQGQIVKNPYTYICPPGKYCPQGSVSPTPCPQGTYSPSLGGSTVTDCQPCPAGSVCSSTGLDGGALANCAQGYYCPAGISVSNPVAYLCEAGYQCPAGSTYQKICQPGTYQPARGQKNCLDCPAGSYCDGTKPAVAEDCKAGFYCPLKTQFAQQYPCPPGTYNPNTKKTSLSDCINIPPGYYSDKYGISAASLDQKLQRGTYSLASGLQSPYQTPCPLYHYCPDGTSSPKPCENGKTTLGEGSTDISDCVKCPKGKFCKFYDYFSGQAFSPSLISGVLSIGYVYGDCDAGYICSGGSDTAQPTDGVKGYACPAGSYCLQGAIIETKCSPGTYNDLVGQPTCFTCPIGTFCNTIGMTLPLDCLPGHYCPEGSIRSIPCPSGTYNPNAKGGSLADCLPCDKGKFCDLWGLTTPAGKCEAGYICVSGSNTPSPFAVIHTVGSSLNGRCPPGYYCESGAETPLECPEGSYNPNPGQGACLTCPKGQYCSGKGLTKPTGLCEETYLCDESSISSKGQTISTGTSSSSARTCDPKVEGYCPIGAVKPITCKDGLFLDDTGKCVACEKGKRCINGEKPADCPVQKFCADGPNKPYGELCPNGTTGEKAGLTKAEDCVACPAKSFCVAGKVMDVCNAGYICLSGADSPTPYNRTGAYACPKGFYCSPGASSPSICPIGMYTYEPGAVQLEECDYCQEGYYCEYGAIDAMICPPGNYCPIGSQEPKNCSVTRYNPYKQGTNYASCLPCKGGYYCYDTGLANLFGYNDTYKCPAGYYCPVATWIPYPCPAGAYSDNLMRFMPSSYSECGVCPEHYYCPQATPFRYNFTCKSGTYCPAGSSWPLLCPPGKYCKQGTDPSTGLNVITITLCPEGYYCPIGTAEPKLCNAKKGEVCKQGSSFPSRTIMSSSICKPGQFFGFGQCNECEAGFVCKNNTNTKYPVYLTIEGGYECPAGYYCPKGSAIEIACPKGTYRQDIKATSLADCLQCPSDSYSDQVGQTVCIKCGRGSIGSKSSGYESCVCLGQFRQWRRSDNQCICQTGYREPALPTIEGLTSTDSQDCIPDVEAECSSGTHYDTIEKSCVSDSFCQKPELCKGAGDKEGYYSSSAKKCLCRNVDNSAEAYCDSSCKNKALKAYLTKDGQICLKAGSQKECYDKSVFGQSLFLDGLTCPSECEMSSLNNEQGGMQGSFEAAPIFVKKWMETHPDYVSPYSKAIPAKSSNNSVSLLRMLQTSGPSYIDSAIICAKPTYPVSFAVSREHFPVYLKDSLYNTNADFDSGVFDLLQTKLVQANMSINTFMYSFAQEGVYVFGDYKNQLASITIIKVSQSLCSSNLTKNGNIFPLTEDNLATFEISPQSLQLKTLPESLIAIPVIFIVLTFISTYVQYKWETKIERDEQELRMKRAGRKRNFSNAEGKLDKRQYLADLYKLIKDNMDEVTRMINEHDNKVNLLKLLKDKTSLLNELGEGGKSTVDELKTQLKTLLEQLRFPDGSTLKELLGAKELQKKLQQTLNKDSNEDPHHDEELDMDELDRHTASDGSSDVDDDESEALTDAVSRNLAEADSDEERTKEKVKDRHLRELEVERQLKLKREQDRRKNDFKDRICDLIDDEGDRDKLIDGFDDKMRSLDHMLRNENQRQEDSLADKLADRRNRRKKAMAELQQKTGDKEKRVEKLEEEKRILQEELEEVLDNGMKDPQLQQIASQEKAAALEKIERQILEKQELVRAEYLNRLRNAKSDKEKERIVDEMQRRLQAVEDELQKEKAEQERNLEKILLMRQQKRVKKIAHQHEQEIEKRDQEIKILQQDIDMERAKIYVEHGGDVIEALDSAVKDKADKLIEKSVLGKTTALNLDKHDIEQLEILKVQQKIDREHALSAVEKEIEAQIEMDKMKMEEDLKNKIQKQKEDLNQKISKAKSEAERKQLIAESKNMEQKLEDEMQTEKLKQERLLEEKRKNRQNLRKVKEIELEQKQMQELAQKETELLARKYDKLMDDHHSSFDKEMNTAMAQLERRGNADKAILLVNQTANDMLEKKLRLLINKQFFELEKYLGTMYNQTALERMAALEKSRARFKAAEQEAYATLQGDALVARLNQLKELEKTENESIEARFKQKEKEQETEIRERLENKFFEEKKRVQDEDKKKREELIKGILERNGQEGEGPSSQQLQEIAKKLLEVNDNRSKEELEKMEREKEENMERIKLQIVADNEAEVQRLQKSIEEQMAKEKEMVESRMKAKRDEVIGGKKKALEDRIKEMSGSLSEYQKDMIMKQFMIELNNLEKAIAMERDSQLIKMRQRLIKKKIEAERLKKEEAQEKRVQAIKKQIGQYLLAQIKQRREQASQSRIQVPQAPVAKPGSSSGRRQGAGRPSSKQVAARPASGAEMTIVSAKDQLRLLLQQWNERVKEQQAADADQQNIWEKRTADKVDSPKSSVSKMSKITGLQALGRSALNASNMMSGQANYTMEELMRRIRRIEKLTERMSQGNFEFRKHATGSNGGDAAFKQASNIIHSIHEGSLSNYELKLDKQRSAF